MLPFSMCATSLFFFFLCVCVCVCVFLLSCMCALFSKLAVCESNEGVKNSEKKEMREGPAKQSKAKQRKEKEEETSWLKSNE